MNVDILHKPGGEKFPEDPIKVIDRKNVEEKSSNSHSPSMFLFSFLSFYFLLLFFSFLLLFFLFFYFIIAAANLYKGIEVPKEKRFEFGNILFGGPW